MKLKKMFALLAAVVFAVVALAGCGGSNGSGSKGDKKVLKVGTNADFAPFEFQDKEGKEYQGFDMDLIRAVGEQMGYKVEIENRAFDGLIPALTAKDIDVVISGMSINDERKKKVDVSDPYYDSGLTIVVRKDDDRIKNFEGLKGMTVAVQIGTTSAKEVKKIEGVNVRELNSSADTFLELNAGGVDAVVNDKPVNENYIATSGDGNVKELADRLTSEQYGIAVSKGNTELVKKIDDALKALHENGKYDEIYKKWFKAGK